MKNALILTFLLSTNLIFGQTEKNFTAHFNNQSFYHSASKGDLFQSKVYSGMTGSQSSPAYHGGAIISTDVSLNPLAGISFIKSAQGIPQGSFFTTSVKVNPTTSSVLQGIAAVGYYHYEPNECTPLAASWSTTGGGGL